VKGSWTLKLGIFWAMGLAAGLMPAACGHTAVCGSPVGLPKNVQNYRLSFEDNFDRLDISSDGKAGHTWYNGIWFRSELPPLEVFQVHDSTLSIHWKKGQKVADSSITTMPRGKGEAKAWRYGYFEARMKWTPVKGAWPAFWLVPVQDAQRTNIYGGVRETGELDVFEGQGEEDRIFFATIHDWVNDHDVSSNGSNNRFKIPDCAQFSDYHTYGLLWEPGNVTWYFDNVPIHSETTKAIFDKQDFYLVLGMQAGRNWKYGNLEGVSATDMELDVDWVRVWQKSHP